MGKKPEKKVNSTEIAIKNKEKKAKKKKKSKKH
jgi:hypothetical protein